ncbi:MAG: CheY-like chemotaxis protein [Polaribacter sp.]|jgi:CheY-like chemotaxis protein
MKALYVEDNPINRLVISKSLQGFCEIKTEENGFVAIEMAKSEAFDIFILDLNLADPKIDGFGVLQNLKFKENQKAIYIALTAYTGQEWEDKCLNAGFDLYFSKPVDVKKMWQLISDMKAT